MGLQLFSTHVDYIFNVLLFKSKGHFQTFIFSFLNVNKHLKVKHLKILILSPFTYPCFKIAPKFLCSFKHKRYLKKIFVTKQLIDIDLHSIFFFSQCLPATVWIPTIFKISSFESHAGLEQFQGE